LFDGEGGGKPFYLSPDPKQAALLMDVTKQIINEIYHSVGLAGERTKQDNSQGIDNSSGVAKQNDFERVTSLLMSKADSLETVENRMIRIVAAWAGESLNEDLVNYPDNFDARGLWDEFDIAMQLSLVQAPGMIRADQMEDLVQKLFPAKSQEEIDAINSKVQEWGKRIDESALAVSEGLANKRAQVAGEATRDRSAATQKGNETKAENLPKQQQAE
jgi:hypothetical protein